MRRLVIVCYRRTITVLKIWTVLFLMMSVYFAISQIHALTYDRETNCCRHMAAREFRFFKKLGFDVQYIIGGYSNTSIPGHAWIRVFGIDIDSVTLLPMVCVFDMDKFDTIANFSVIPPWLGL